MEYEYDIFVPTLDKNDKPFRESVLSNLKKKLIDRFGGLTETHHANKGYWRVGAVTIRDEINIWRVVTSELTESELFIRSFKQELTETLQQDATLIVKREVEFM